MTTSTAMRCPCGAIKIELSGEPVDCFYCHCDDCQVVHGAAYLPAALYRMEQTRVVAGEPLRWKRKVTTRATCKRCGTRVFAEPPGLEVRTFPAYLLPKGLFAPTFHMHCAHARLPVRDELPHYKGCPARFGGCDELVPW